MRMLAFFYCGARRLCTMHFISAGIEREYMPQRAPFVTVHLGSGYFERWYTMGKKSIAILSSAVVLAASWMPLGVATTVAVGGAAVMSGCGTEKADTRQDTRTESRTEDRMENRRD